MSSYRPDEKSPSDRADIASWTEPDAPFCDLCGADCTYDEFSDEAGLFVCVACIEQELESQ